MAHSTRDTGGIPVNANKKLSGICAFIIVVTASVAGVILADNAGAPFGKDTFSAEVPRQTKRTRQKTVATKSSGRRPVSVTKSQRRQVPRVRIEDLRNVRTVKLNARPNMLHVRRNTLVVGSFWDATVCLFDRTTGKRRQRLVLVKSGDDVELVEDNGHRAIDRNSLAPLTDMVVANGKLFILPAFTKSLLVLDVSTLNLKAMLPLGGDAKLTVSPNERFVYRASNIKPEFHIIDTRTLKFRSVPYPKGGRGIGAIAVSPDGRQLYLGIQRGGSRKKGPPVFGGNTFLAVYDLVKQRYVGTVYLAEVNNGRSDDSTPSVLLVRPGGLLYVGLRGSQHTYRVVDLGRLAIDHDVDVTVPHDAPWPDVAGGGFVGDTLVSLHRGGEVHLWDTKRRRLLRILEVGAWSGRWSAGAIVHDGVLYVAHPQHKCVYCVPLDKWKRRSEDSVKGK